MSEPLCHFPTDSTPSSISVRPGVRHDRVRVPQLPNKFNLSTASSSKVITTVIFRYHLVRPGIYSKTTVGPPAQQA
jgi:hypothetical protein